MESSRRREHSDEEGADERERNSWLTWVTILLADIVRYWQLVSIDPLYFALTGSYVCETVLKA